MRKPTAEELERSLREVDLWSDMAPVDPGVTSDRIASIADAIEEASRYLMLVTRSLPSLQADFDEQWYRYYREEEKAKNTTEQKMIATMRMRKGPQDLMLDRAKAAEQMCKDRLAALYRLLDAARSLNRSASESLAIPTHLMNHGPSDAPRRAPAGVA